MNLPSDGDKVHSLPALFTTDLLEQAYLWLCHSRANFPHNSDIWHLRYHWARERPRLLQHLNTGCYTFSPLQIVATRHGHGARALWSAPDALVIKCLTLLLTGLLPVHRTCEHIAGNGGGKKSVVRLQQVLHQGNFRFVCRTDIRGYYARIDKSILFQQVQQHVHHPILLDLVHQFLHYSVEEGGNFHTPVNGIARSSLLSLLLAAFHLYCVDRHFANQKHLYYRRYMDDFIIFTRSRWHLRQAVRELNQFLNQFGFVQHPDKTFIGPLHKGVDWMGAWLTDQGRCTIAPRALTNHLNTLRRLYEQTRTLSPQGQAERVARYVHRWRQWALSLCSLCRDLRSLETRASRARVTQKTTPN